MTILDQQTFIKHLLREFHFTNMVRMCQLQSFHSARDAGCDQVGLSFGLSFGHFSNSAFCPEIWMCELHGTWDGAVPLGAELGDQ